MKITLDLDEEIKPAIELHLAEEILVQSYIKAALRFFNTMYQLELKGNSIGYGDKTRFSSYNTVVSPKNYLDQA